MSKVNKKKSKTIEVKEEITNLRTLQTLAYKIILDKGFVELYNRPMVIMETRGNELSSQQHAFLYQDQLFRDATELAHIACEVFEAFNELRKKKCNRTKLEEEVADIIIKTLSFSSRLDIDVVQAVNRKLREIEKRGILHDRRF